MGDGVTYALSRPIHLKYTAVRSVQGVIHVAKGWDFIRHTRTHCGAYIKFDGDYRHIYDSSEESVRTAFDTGRSCPSCIKRLEKLK